MIAANPGHSDTRMTERHYAHLVPSHVAQVIRATMPKLGLVEQSYVVPLTPAPTTVPQLATRFVRNWCLPGHDAPHWIAECHSPCGLTYARAKVRLPKIARPPNDPQYGSNGV